MTFFRYPLAADALGRPLTLLRFEIARRRQEAGLSLRDLAKKSGVNWRTLMDIERGAARPRLATLARIADALHCKISLTPWADGL